MSDSLRSRKNAATSTSPPIAEGAILDDQEQEKVIADLKDETTTAAWIVQVVLSVLTGAAMLASFFLSEGPGNNFTGPPLVSFLLTLRPLIPGLSVKPSLQTPWPRLISLILLLLAPAEKIHNAYGADLSKIPQAVLSGQAVDKAGLSLVGELVPIVTSVVAGGVEFWMRGLHQGVDALEGKKYPVKGA